MNHHDLHRLSDARDRIGEALADLDRALTPGLTRLTGPEYNTVHWTRERLDTIHAGLAALIRQTIEQDGATP